MPEREVICDKLSRKKTNYIISSMLSDFVLHTVSIYLDWSDEFGVAVGVVLLGLVGGGVAAPAAAPCEHHTDGLLVPQLHDVRPDDVAF